MNLEQMTPPTRILLVRHGHVEGIDPARFRGRQDVPLTARGLGQAQAVARCIASRWQPARVYTSPLRRCVETGREIAAACGAPTEPVEQLNDIDYGDWQWLTHAEVAAQWPDLFERWRRSPHWMRVPRGESLQALVSRVSDALIGILQRHATETVVLVGHDSSNRALLLQLLDQPLSAYGQFGQDPCGLSEVEVYGSKGVLRRMNETQHLSNTPQ